MKHTIKSIQILSIILFFLIFFTGCSKKNEEPQYETVSKSRLILGTSVKITIYDNPSEEAFSKSFERARDIENKMSTRISSSEVSSINKNAGIKPVVVSNDTFSVIKKAVEVASISNGAFDPTVGALVSAWNIGSEDARVPSQDEINSLLPLIGYEMITLNEEEKSVFLNKKGMEIDLGGIAKGYAADEIAKILSFNNVEKAIINLGGNVLTVGRRTNGEKWRIGVQNPELERGNSVVILHLEDLSLVTSGPYERFLEVDGVTYHHILNTDTGYPVVTNLTSASIIASNSLLADALSTAIFSLGKKEGLTLINSLEDVEAVFIDKNNDIYLSQGFKDKSINYSINDDSFKVVEK